MTVAAFDIEMTVPGVLKAGKWAAAAELAGSAAALRAALVQKLVEHSRQPRDFFEAMPDDRLVGCGAVAVLLLASGVRDQAGLKTMTDDDQRNTLIVETGGRTGRTGGEMWGLDNRGLVRLALQWFAATPLAAEPGSAGLPAASFRDPTSAAGTDRTALAYFQMLFERARAHFLASRFDESAALLTWLVKVVPFTLDTSNASEEYKLVVQPLIDSFLALQDHAEDGRDYFGFTTDQVPAFSVAHATEQLNRNLASLKTLEEKYGSYQLEGRTLAERQSDYAEAVGQTSTLVHDLTLERQAIRAQLGGIVDEIEAAGVALRPAKAALTDEIGGLKEQIFKVFNMPDPQQLSNILVNLAFMPEAAPQKAVMGASQVLAGVSAVMKSANSLRLEDGTEVARSLVINRVQTVGSDVSDFGAAYTVMSQNFIQPSDGVYRLYQRQQDFDALCQQLYDNAPRAVEVKAAMDALVRKVAERNSKIDQYNALWARAGDIDGQLAKLRGDKRAQETILARSEQPGIHFQVAALNNLHGRARDNCLKYLALMGRAYAFWALRPYDQLDEVCKLADPDAIDHDTLQTARDQILNDLDKYLQDVMAKLRQGSIPDENTELTLAKGIEVELTPDSHPDFFKGLKASGVGSFELLPDDPQFLGLANVRVKRVRAWVHGLLPEKALNMIEVTHGDQDVIVGVDGAEHRFRHDPVTVLFRYDPTKGIEDPKAIFGGKGTDGLLDDKIYAPLGTFATWTVDIPEGQATGFSRADISKVVMEFHVLAQGFDTPRA